MSVSDKGARLSLRRAEARLKSRGYAAHVARAIAAQPTIAMQALSAGSQGAKPVTVYRGIARETFSPRFFSKRYKGDVYTSKRIETAVRYGGKGKNPGAHGIVLELQVPAFLLSEGNFGNPVIAKSSSRDIRPFIRRVGLVKVGAKSTHDVSWQPSSKIDEFVRYRK